MEAKETASYLITIQENGPYIVTGGVPLIKRAPAFSTFGEPLDWDPVGDKKDRPDTTEEYYELCRCGKSANKPFCDKSHERIGFVGELTADRGPISSRWRVFEGGEIKVTDDNSLCTHAGFCGTRFATIWMMLKRAEDPEVQERIMRMVQRCPSGRIVVSYKDGEPLEPHFAPSIAQVPDGQLWVRGGIRIQAPDGFVYEVRNRVSLCRCGGSKNKPFCDGTHEDIGFEAP